MKKILAIALLATLTACQTPTQVSVRGQLWSSIIAKDQFTDKVTKMVTIGEGLSNQIIVTQSLKYYPFVGVQDGEIYVGIRSGGRYRIPTGTVQIRIDENPAWTIGPEETPVYLSPLLPSSTVSAFDSDDMAEKTQAKVMENMVKIMSPYTAATGDKAKSIIRQMLFGKTVKYRTVGINQAASTTGEVVIDESFKNSLREIGIIPETL